MGRAWKFTWARRREFLDNLREGKRRGIAARAVGVCGLTVEKRMKKDVKFREAVFRAEKEANEGVEDALYQSAMRGNVVAQQVWLYNRCPELWADRRQVDKVIRGEVHHSHLHATLESNTFKNASDGEILKIMGMLDKLRSNSKGEGKQLLLEGEVKEDD